MKISQSDLAAAAKAGVITNEQAKKLAEFWQETHADVPSFKLTHILYYFGGFLAISAISLFVTSAWDLLYGLPLFILSTLLFIFGLLLTRYFLDKKLTIPAGIMATFSLVVVPLAVYNLQSWLGYFPKTSFDYVDYHSYVSWSWMPMEVTTLLAGVVMLYIYRFPFLVFPIAVTLWYMSMDLVPLILHKDSFSWESRSLFSMYFGLIMLVIAFYLDIRNDDDKKDYAFWLYLFGVMAFWGGLSSQNSTSELSRFIYCLINIFMILISVFLNRRVFAVFGAIGVLGYIGHLSFSVFANSIGFPIALVFMGVLIILAASRWTKVENKLFEALKPFIPAVILKRQQR